jgi:hypothetical protein
MQTPGIPDVEAFLPRAATSGIPACLLAWECKAVGGRLSPSRKLPRSVHRRRRGTSSVPFDALIAWLAEHDYVKASQFPTYRQPAGQA